MGQNAGVGRDNDARPNSSAEVCDGSIENGGGGDRCDFPGLGDRLFSIGAAPRFAGHDGARTDRFGLTTPVMPRGVNRCGSHHLSNQ
jgi:hypothetical protein